MVLLVCLGSCSAVTEEQGKSFTEQFISNISGNYTSVATTLSINNTSYNLVANRGIRLDSDEVTIVLEETGGTILSFTLSDSTGARTASYIYEGTPVTVTLDEDDNILIDDVIVAKLVKDTVVSAFASNIQGGYVATKGSPARYLGFLLDEHTHSPIGEDLHITLIQDNGTPVKLIHTQVIDSSNAIYLQEGKTRSSVNDIPVQILRNGDLSINGTTLLQKIQDNAPEFPQNISKMFITKNITVTLGDQTFGIIKHKILQVNLNKDIVIATDKGPLTLRFERAIHANEGIFDYTINGVTDKENISIQDETDLILEGVTIAQTPNPAIEHTFKENISYSSYASVNSTIIVGGKTFNFLENSIFDITEDSLNIPLKTSDGSVVWEYVFAYTDTMGVYQYNGNYIVMVVDIDAREIKASVNGKVTKLVESADVYYKKIFVDSLTSKSITIIKPSFTHDKAKYHLPILPFTPTDEHITITDKNGETFQATFIEIIDENEARYKITTKRDFINNIIVRYENGDLFVGDQLIATQTKKLTALENNFLGRYFLFDKEREYQASSYAYINSKDDLIVYVNYKNVIRGYEMVMTLKTAESDIEGSFTYTIYYNGNVLKSRDTIPREVQDMISTTSQAIESQFFNHTVNMVYKDTSIYYKNNNRTAFLTKILKQP